MRSMRGLDLAIYVRAFAVLARNPALLLAPFFMAVVGVLMQMPYGRAGDPVSQITGGIVGLIVFLLECFGLGVSLIIADTAWRRGGTASFDGAWIEARRKAGDIFMAALGFNFVIYIASLIGGFINPYLAYLCSAAALYFLIYTIPAAAIGGIPGGAALQVSIERVQRSYVASALLVVVSIAAYWFIGSFLPLQYVPLEGMTFSIVMAFCKAVALAYIACILAAVYAQVSYR